MKRLSVALCLILLSGCLQCYDPIDLDHFGHDQFLLGKWEGEVWPLGELPIPVSMELMEESFVVTYHFDDFDGIISGKWASQSFEDNPKILEWSTQCSNAADLVQSRHIFWVYTYDWGVFTFASRWDMWHGQGHPDQTGPFYILHRTE